MTAFWNIAFWASLILGMIALGIEIYFDYHENRRAVRWFRRVWATALVVSIVCLLVGYA